jgi:peptidoglycan/LPS O-acetylase OafA/YrhL
MAGDAEREMPVREAAPRDRTYLPALTGLRFFLALWVILHHLTGKGMMLEQWETQLPHAAQSLLRGGYLAVQTFFILSGFVLAQSYASARWNLRSLIRFGVARFARIYPAYLFSLLVVSRFMLESLSRPGRTAGQKAVLLSDYGLLLQGWTGALGVGWNTPAWSLSCEFFFYLCFPLLFLWMRDARWPKLAGAMGISLAVPIILAHAGIPTVWKPIHHLADFLAGIAAAGLYDLIARSGGQRMRRRGFLLYIPALALGAALIIYPAVLRGTLVDLNTALRPLNVALLIGLALEGGIVAHGLATSAAGYLGRASYSMYVIHVPVLWWYTRYAFHRMGTPPYTATALVYLAFVIAASIAVFELVESPANRWIRAWARG